MGRESEVRDDGVVILEVAGEVDAFNLPRFCEQVQDIFREGTRKIVLDLRKLEFADSKMIGQLLDIQKRFRKAGGNVVLLRPGRFVMRTLEALGLDAVFTLCRSQEEALRALATGGEGTPPGPGGCGESRG